MSDYITINLAQRYASAFGLLYSSSKADELVVKQESDGNFKIYDGYNEEIDELVFESETKRLAFGNVLTSEGGGRFFAPPMKLRFTRRKKLIVTETNEGVDSNQNVFIEHWATKPWSIEMSGLLIDLDDRQYPADEIEALHQFFEQNEVIKVDGVQFDDKAVDSLYFTSIDFETVDGFSDTIQYKLRASSIKEVDYNLLKSY